jgi:hypothetical protein
MVRFPPRYSVSLQPAAPRSTFPRCLRLAPDVLLNEEPRPTRRVHPRESGEHHQDRRRFGNCTFAVREELDGIYCVVAPGNRAGCLIPIIGESDPETRVSEESAHAKGCEGAPRGHLQTGPRQPIGQRFAVNLFVLLRLRENARLKDGPVLTRGTMFALYDLVVGRHRAAIRARSYYSNSCPPRSCGGMPCTEEWLPVAVLGGA